MTSKREYSYEDLVARIHYSDKYSDDVWEYRHVILPKQLLKILPQAFFDPNEPSVLRILSDEQWRSIGIQQSPGWEHYEVHGTWSFFSLSLFLLFCNERKDGIW